jgi:hypothetical protein
MCIPQLTLRELELVLGLLEIEVPEPMSAKTRRRRLSSPALHPGAAAIALAGTLVVLFVLCALYEFASLGPRLSHAWLKLFTAAPTGSVQAWVEGLLASLVFGAIGSALFAAIYGTADDADREPHGRK